MRFLFEGTHYDTNAAKELAKKINIPVEEAVNVIQSAYREKIHAFNHCPNWLDKYIKGISRMISDNIEPLREFTDESSAIKAAYDCVNNWAEDLNFFLTYVKENREKIGSSIDNEFINHMSMEDVHRRVEQIKEEEKKKSEEELASQEFSGESNFVLVPINSFKEFNDMFGGKATGDGKSDLYAGGGGTAWCHANSEDVYDNMWWTDGGARKFYVLANKDWKNIPFDRKSNIENHKDAYGNSLIAILVDKETGELKNATLRCNHVGVERNPDNQYRKYSDLSKIAGFNVEKAVKDDLKLDFKGELEDDENLPIFTGARLLTVKEYNGYIIRGIDATWWLDSSDLDGRNQAFAVDSSGEVSSCDTDNVFGIRPIIEYNNDDGRFDNLKKFKFAGFTWTVVSILQGKALCDDIIGSCKYSNEQGEKTVEKTLDNWFSGTAVPRQEERMYEKYVLLRDPEHTRVETPPFGGPSTTYYRIKILREDLKHNDGDVCLGGWLDSYDCLSQEGSCMVYGSDTFISKSKITGDAKVYGNSVVYNSRISGKAIVRKNCNIDSSVIKDEAWISDESSVTLSTVEGDGIVEGGSVIEGSKIRGTASLRGCKATNSKIGKHYFQNRTFENEIIDYEE